MSDFCSCANCTCNAAEIRSSIAKRNDFSDGITIDNLWVFNHLPNNSAGMGSPRSHIARIGTILYGTVFSNTCDTAHPKLADILRYWKIPLVLAVFNRAIYRISAHSHSAIDVGSLSIRERYIWNAIKNFTVCCNTRYRSKIDIPWIGHIQLALNRQTGNFSAVNLTEKSERRILCFSIISGKIQIGNRMPVSVKFAAEVMQQISIRVKFAANRCPCNTC